MAKTHITLRIDEEALSCLDRLCADEFLRATKYGIKARTRSDFVSEAIQNYYSQVTESSLGDPAMNRMKVAIHSDLLKILTPIIQQQAIDHEELLVVKEYAKLISKGFNWNVPVEQIVKEDPSFDRAIREVALAKNVAENKEDDEYGE